MEGLILYPFLCAALYHLGARAKITEPLWSRYPLGFDRFMSCSACAGTWYGAAIAFIGWHLGWTFLGHEHTALTPIIVALCAMVWTPLVAALHEHALYQLGSSPNGWDDNASPEIGRDYTGNPDEEA